jgi:hypothetical protein
MPMGRGARNTAAQARLIAVSILSSNVKPRFRETEDFATATLGQGMAPNGEADIGKVGTKLTLGMWDTF